MKDIFTEFLPFILFLHLNLGENDREMSNPNVEVFILTISCTYGYVSQLIYCFLLYFSDYILI